MTNRVRKRRISALCIGLLFALTTAIGILGVPQKTALAAESDGAFKFKQMAVGEDFAIALSYNNELYAWSLLPEDEHTYKGEGLNPEYGDSLGQYYPTNPIRIAVDFRGVRFERSSEKGVTLTKIGELPNKDDVLTNENNRQTYVGGADDNIVQIAATRTTAAFVTRKGLIYTWGKESYEPLKNGEQTTQLLFRNPTYEGNGTYVPQKHNYTPALIDYNKHHGLLPLGHINSSMATSIQSIAGSDFNYIVHYNGQNNTQGNYVWGQSQYLGGADVQSIGNYTFGRDYANGELAKTANTRAYLGDGNVYYFSSGTTQALKVRGKNFAVADSAIMASADGTITSGIVNTLFSADNETSAYTKNKTGDDFLTIKNAVTGKQGEDGTEEYYRNIASTSALTFTNASPVNPSAAKFYTADSLQNPTDTAIETQRSAFAAGAGYGYLLDGGKLYFWGDNRLGQNGGGVAGDAATAFAASDLDGKYVQVVAGKIKTGDSILEGYSNTDANYQAQGKPDKWSAFDTQKDTADPPVVTGYTGTLDSAYVDGNTYLSAVLDENGSVTVFGALDGKIFAPQSLDDRFAAVGVQISKSGKVPANRVALLVSGYENHLFAISSLGKIYEITASVTNENGVDKFSFACDSVDGFRDENGKEYDNWAVNTKNVAATFSTKYNSTTDTSEGYFTDNSVVSVGLTANGKTGNYAEVSEDTAIDNNRSGDAFRMLLPIEQGVVGNTDAFISLPSELTYAESGTKHVDAEATGIAGTPTDDFRKMTFYWSDAPAYKIPDAVVARYFSIRYTYTPSVETDESTTPPQIGFTIVPKQSTAGKSIIIKYWIGRFDSVMNFDNVKDNLSTAFYDFKQASVSVTIADTHAEKVFTSAADESESGNSAIPLLDPNNPDNNTYSLTVMNVSEGFTQVLTKLEELLGNTFNRTAAQNALIEDVIANDSGFPATEKAAKLAYYNANATSFYNGAYRYLVKDRDDDILYLDTANPVNPSNNPYFATALRTGDKSVEVFMPFGTTVTGDKLAELQNWFQKTTNNGNVPWFANKYGFTMDVQQEGITFRYEVLTVTALSSMPGAFVGYETVDGKTDVSRPVTAVNADERVNGLRPRIHYGTSGQAGYYVDNFNNDQTDGGGKNRVVEIFTQSSLTFLKQWGDKNSLSHDVYGDPTANNVYEFDADSVKPGIDAVVLKPDVVGVGINQNKYTVNLSNLFKDDTNMYFTYNGTHGNYDALKDTFASGSNANALGLEAMGEKSFTILAKHAVTDYEFTLEIRRFVPGRTDNGFVGDTPNQSEEIAYVHFKVTVDFNPKTSFSRKDGIPDSLGKINKNTELNISDRMNLANGIPGLVTVEAKSSNPSVLTVDSVVSDGKAVLVLKPRTSGTVFVRYVVKLYDYEISDSFRVDVATLFSMGNTVKVIDEERVYFSDLINYLISVNNLGAETTLTPADYEGTNLPYRFEQTTDKSSVDADNNWTPLESVGFLRTVYLDPSSNDRAQQKYIGFVMGSFESTTDKDSMPITRAVVRFTDGAGNYYEISFRLAPAAQTLNDPDNHFGSALSFEINKKNEQISLMEHDDGVTDAANKGVRFADGNYVIPLSYLTELMYDKKEGLDRYSIVAVNATASDNNPDKYLTVINSTSTVSVRPLYPTSMLATDSCNIQVSVRDKETHEVTLLNFAVRITGIDIVLESDDYRMIVIIVFFSVLALLIIIFFIRMGVYWKKKADQRRIIKKNQTLIKMRDKMHQKTDGVKKEQLVRTKLKMEDPKYARMFNEMRKNKEEQTGIVLENSLVAQKADRKDKANKAAKKKKKGGKKSLEELQAELAAKRELRDRMEMGDFSAMPEDMAPITDAPVEDIPVDQTMAGDMPLFDTEFGDTSAQPDAVFGESATEENILFEMPDDNGENNQG